MKATRVLLRWYKSFNVNYLGYPDRRHQVKVRPWTSLGVPREIGDRWAFIEIPLESDITTIVGANESGKSHLLSAIAKVITGKGLPDERDRFIPFDKVDLCHYASVRNKNASAWPNIGIEFSEISDSQWAKLSKAVNQSLKADRFTLVLAAGGDTVPSRRERTRGLPLSRRCLQLRIADDGVTRSGSRMSSHAAIHQIGCRNARRTPY